jgi:hypothetical protein
VPYALRARDDLTAVILMTDGVSDSKFETEANLARPQAWDTLWDDLDHALALHERADSSEKRRLAWLDFWSQGNHDERTITIVYKDSTLTASDGQTVQIVGEVKASGGMKDVYLLPKKDYVVAFFRGEADNATRERLAVITTIYRERIFQQAGGDYWNGLFCWPTATLEHRGRIGVVAPFYDPDFLFKFGSQNNDMLAIKGE